jgi:sugar-specific transcriptional regulator TrmB
MPEIYGRKTVVEFLAKYYHGNNFQKYLVAKYLTLPKSGRTQSRDLQIAKRELIKAFSNRVGLRYEVKLDYIYFTGYCTWRKEYNKDLESVLFSSGRVLNFSKDDFLKWLEHVPAQARHRVKKKLMTKEGQPKKEKYGTLVEWFKVFENFKLQKQEEKREIESVLQQKKSGLVYRSLQKSSLEDKSIEELEAMRDAISKEAKVTVGGTNFQEMLKEIVKGTIDKTKIEPFLDKINLPYNTLVFVDDSGSMNSSYGSGYPYTPADLANFIATICLMKNPDEEARSLVGLFSSSARFYGNITKQSASTNRLMRSKEVQSVHKPLFDNTKSFLYNYEQFTRFMNAHRTGNLTHIDRVADTICRGVEEYPEMVDSLAAYPVWTFISDGNFNNLSQASSSLGQMFKLLEEKMGFKPYVLLIDVARNTSQKITNFVGLDNVMMVPPSPANIELFLTNFKDMDSYDVYTPLLSLSRSNRYDPVRSLFSL